MGDIDALYLLRHVGLSLERQFDQVLLEQLGIGMSQHRIMTVLKLRPDISQRALATHLGQTEASISRQIRILQAKTLVSRVVHPTIKRERVIALSSKGALLVAAADELLTKLNAGLLQTLTERQRRNLTNVLTTIHDHGCTNDTPHSCDHSIDLIERAESGAYLLAIS
ncbi:MAG TPA: MarR family winged helix-turn-helix transcriptional regulator [Candidatus Saccharimonadales bacterium]|nr:MarR family winged helix-turn-helix transcriptional regulator [Candidatus Saccharimonadales bacterium]